MIACITVYVLVNLGMGGSANSYALLLLLLLSTLLVAWLFCHF